MKLVFNADDFGHSKGVNLGIIEAFQNGAVRSTTMMAGMPGFEHAVQLYRQNPGLGVGVHLTLTAGYAVGGVYQTLTDRDGCFLKRAEIERRAAQGLLDPAEIEQEYEAQIQKIRNVGIEPTHFDSHHHIHNLNGVARVFLKLAKKYNKKVRIYDQSRLSGEYAGIRTPAVFADTFFDQTVSAGYLKHVITECQGDSLEIMCHPAYLDLQLYQTSSYNLKRIFELGVLTGSELKGFIEEQGITLCSYNEV